MEKGKKEAVKLEKCIKGDSLKQCSKLARCDALAAQFASNIFDTLRLAAEKR